jgi:ribonucleoside-diphosphate reductase alpha chain
MGIHEWLLQMGSVYEMTTELENWLLFFSTDSREHANKHADDLGVARPIAVNAIAPTGSLSILAETTGSIEPIYCAAYKRRHHSQNGLGGKNGVHWQEKVMVDPVARRLLDKGVKPEDIEDSYALSEQIERRIKFQADVQEFIDQGISSTINMPAWGSRHNNLSTLESYRMALLRHLPRLRGITVYPDGARSGQPLTPVSLAEAEATRETGFVPGSFCDTVCG